MNGSVLLVNEALSRYGKLAFLTHGDGGIHPEIGVSGIMEARQDDRSFLEFLATRWRERIYFLATYFLLSIAYDLYRGYGLISAFFWSIGVNVAAYGMATTIVYLARRGPWV